MLIKDMALVTKVHNIPHIRFQILYCACKSGIISCFLRGKSMAVDADLLDTFTTQLVQKKSDKWETLKIKRCKPSNSIGRFTAEATTDGVEHMNRKEIDVKFHSVLEVCDNESALSLLVKECIKHEKCPSVSVLVNVLTVFAARGNIEGISDTKAMCKDVHSDFVASNSHFNHYLAEAVWIKGNVSKALALFTDVYKTNSFLRRRIRLMLKYLIYDAVTNRSEAVVFCILKFADDLAKNHKDFYALTCLWQVCLLSEWYTDQCLALEVLEKNDGFLRAVMNQIPYIVSGLLKYHKTELVYRLLEILLQNEMKLQYSVVLFSLFDYRFRQGDLASCLEIYNWSVKYNVTLPTVQHEKFLKLLLNHESIARTKLKEISAPTFHLKF